MNDEQIRTRSMCNFDGCCFEAIKFLPCGHCGDSAVHITCFDHVEDDTTISRIYNGKVYCIDCFELLPI